MSLLDEVVEAYGGLGRWKELDTIKIHQTVGGVLWPLKGVDGVINDSTVEIRVQEQRVWHRPLPKPGFRSSYSPERVAIETDDDSAVTVEVLNSPRESFEGHGVETPWSMLQMAYFAGYAMWTYLTEPYSLTFPGVHTEEIGSWNEDGQTWRRLAVRYPDTVGTHSADQVVYVDSDGLLRRRDYQVDIAAGAPAAHYMNDHREFGGVIIPMQRIVHSRDDNGYRIPEPVTVSVDIDEVVVS